ncbi:MAG: M36 family metallopeptidase [Candidatus Promineifilaceae bacterium]
MKRNRSLIVAGLLAVFLIAMVFALANSASAKTGETAVINLSGSGLVPDLPGTYLTGPNVGEPLGIALDFIQANKAALQMSAAEISDLVVKDEYLSQKSGTTHIYFLQNHNGIEVYNAMLNMNIAQDGSVMNVGNRIIPNLTTAVQGTEPQITAETAVEKAAEYLSLELAQTPVVEQIVGGAAQAVVLSDSGISLEPIPAYLIYQPMADGTVRLAWNLTIREQTGHDWWNIRVDAVTGEELDRSNFAIKDEWGDTNQSDASHNDALNFPLLASAVPSSYLAYGMPIESPNYATPAPPADARTTEVTPWLDAPTASPMGWHATSSTSWTDTQGNNVDAHKGSFHYDCGASLECDPPLDLTMNPATNDNRDSAIVNLFYWNNIVHDVTYEYGFDEAAGNFQNDNFGMGGVGNDRVYANSQLGVVCNAFFTTPSDGSSGIMDMYICPIASPSRDGSLDSGVMAHEYTHGISNRLTGGPSNVNCLNNSEQMGEGWSDLTGLILTMEVGDAGSDSRGIGTWLLGEGPGGPGVRNYPYTTDLNINPHTYNDIIGAGNSHDVGEVWASIVWEAVWALTDAHGFNPNFYNDYTTGGNNLALQLMIEGMKLQPCSPGFVDGRDAILLADQNLTGGANQCLLWEAFAKRGLGFSASQGSSGSNNDNSEAFDTPAFCQNAPEINLSVTQLGGTINQNEMLTQTLTISNTGLSDLDWTIGEGSLITEGSCGTPGDLPWVSVSPTSGTTAMGSSDDVTVVFDATGLPGGSYTGELCVSSNDPLNQEAVVQLDLTVNQTDYYIYLPAIHNQ